MIECTKEQVRNSTVARLSGRLSDHRAAERVARDLLSGHRAGEPLVVDLSGLDDADFEPISWLVLDLEASPSWREVRLVDSRLDTSRQIRAATRRLPVLPDVATALVVAGVMPV
jgi:hypothetical protein